MEILDLPWEAALDRELVQLVEQREFDFEGASMDLRKAIRLERVPTKTSTRHRASEFTSEACRVRFCFLDEHGVPEPLEDEDLTADLPSGGVEDAVAPETGSDAGKEGAAFPASANDGGDSPGAVGAQEEAAGSVQLLLDAHTERALESLHLDDFRPPNQEEEGGEPTALGEVLHILESADTMVPAPGLAPGAKTLFDLAAVLGDFESEAKAAESQHEAPESAAEPRESTEKAPAASRASESKVETAPKKRAVRKPLYPGERRGTRGEVFAAMGESEGEGSDTDEDEDWRKARRSIKRAGEELAQ